MMWGRRFFILFFLGLIFVANSGEASAADAPYLDSLIQKAHQVHLSEDPYWRVLLHYRHRWYANSKSDIKASVFFNAKDGQSNPQAELDETLKSFFETGAREKNLQHAQCLFIDRYRWLKDQLHFDPSHLPEQKCKEFEEWRAALDPTGVTLVFSSYYMSNPSSTFGHTLIRLNHRKHDSGERLLDYGVNYAANPTTQNAFLYGVMGLVGGFDGVFSNVPYFLKVSEYNDVESRELWEYDLNFNQAQIDRMLLHLWTVGHFGTPYYFFDQNCSYMLLTILDAGRPELGLGDEYDKSWVIPADTVRGVASRPGLVSQVSVRPSLAYRMKREFSELNPEEQGLFFAYARDHSLQTLPPASARKIYDLTLDYYRYLTPRNQGKLLLADQKVQDHTLEARAEMTDPSPEVIFTPKEIEHDRPDGGHSTARFTLGGGRQNSHGNFIEMGIRPAFQDLNAATRGYPRGVQIDLLDFDFHYRTQERQFRLERFNLAQVISLEPYEPMFQKFSWSVRAGADPIRDFECSDCVEYKLSAAYGYSLDILKPLRIYALAKADLGFGPNTTPRYRLGPAGEVGALWSVSDQLSFYGKVTYHHPLLGFLNSYFEKNAEVRFSVMRDLDIRFGYDVAPVAQQGKVLFNVYF